MMKMKRTFFLVIIAAALIPAQAQIKDPGFALSQIARIADVYRTTPNLNFDMTYTYADSTAPSTIFETMNGACAISSGRSWTYIDSVEMVQGGQYSVSVDHRDSTIIVKDKIGYEDLMKVPFLDSMFRNANIDSLSKLENSSDTFGTVSVYFKPGAGFSRYEMKYNKTSLHVLQIKYFVPNTPYDSTGVTSGTAVITLSMEHYNSVVPVNPLHLNEWLFIDKVNGVFVPRAPFTDFTLLNYSNN